MVNRKIKPLRVYKSEGIQSLTNDKPIVLGNRHTKFQTHYRQADFLTLFVQNNGLILRTCTQLNLGYHTLEKWRKDPKFKDRFDIAQQRVNEMMEDSLIQKAMTTNSAVPEIFYLKSRDPRYKQAVTFEGEEDKPIQVTYTKDTLNTITKAIVSMLEKE